MRKKDHRSKDEHLRDRQLRMAILLSEMRSLSEVADIISQEFGIIETRDNVQGFVKSKRGHKLIVFLKRRLLNNLLKVPIANKSIRLNYLQSIYKEAMTESLKSINQYGKIYELKLGAAVEAIKAAREEMEKITGEKPIPNEEEIDYIPENGNIKPEFKNRVERFITSN